MNITLATIETAAGDVHEDLRITVQDRLKLERTARVNKWGPVATDSPHVTEQQVFLAWSSATRAGHTSATFEVFRDSELVDVQFKNAEAVLGDPTQPAPTAG